MRVLDEHGEPVRRGDVDPILCAEHGCPDVVEFHCAECGRKVNTDWEMVLCHCTPHPTCDECCFITDGHGGDDAA